VIGNLLSVYRAWYTKTTYLNGDSLLIKSTLIITNIISLSYFHAMMSQNSVSDAEVKMDGLHQKNLTQ
jgi:hypothetical protein